MSERVVIIGGGIAGLATGYYLNKANKAVTIIDKGNLDDSSSIGNAGFLSMFEKSPMSYPGVFRDTFRAFVKNRSPMVINTVFSASLMRWGYRFYQASKPARYKRTLAVLEHFGEEVFSFYDTLSKVDNVDCEYHRDGFALVYTEPETYKKKLASIASGSPYVKVLSRDEIAETFPLVVPEKVAGALLLKRNGHINPGRVISGLKQLLESRGVRFILGEEVTDLETSGDKVLRAKSRTQSYDADEFVIATGVNPLLPKKLKADLVMTAGKGYSVSFQMKPELKPKVPALFCDIYTAVTPRRDDMRITGKIEFGPSKHLPKDRIDSLVSILKNYTKDFSIEGGKIWSGDRPLTGDDMPYIGRDSKFPNCSYVTGMGHTGMNIGPISGRILSELIVKGQRNIESKDLLLLSEFYQ